MLFEIVFQLTTHNATTTVGCDLMLFEIVFQCRPVRFFAEISCDLMLFEIVFQYWSDIALY